MHIFSIYDTCAKSFGNPTLFPNEAVALRSWAGLLADDDLQYAKHPGDYVLYHLGEFDQESGIITTTAPAPVRRGDQVVLPETLTNGKLTDVSSPPHEG